MSASLTDEPILQSLLDYCTHKRGDRPLPSRVDIDPVEMPRFILPNLMMLDLFDGGARYRYRLCGTETVRRFGKDPTGRFGDEVLGGDYLAYIVSLLREMVVRRAPVYSVSVFRWETNRTMITRRLYVPLADAQGGISQALSAHDFGVRPRLFSNPPDLLREARSVQEITREIVPF